MGALCYRVSPATFLRRTRYGQRWQHLCRGSDSDSSTLATTIYRSHACGTITIFGSVPGFLVDFGLAFDSAGNLYAAENCFADYIYRVYPREACSTFARHEAFSPLADRDPNGLAFDQLRQSFRVHRNNPWQRHNSQVYSNGPVRTIFATGLKDPRGLAFDGEVISLSLRDPNYPLGDILKFTPGRRGKHLRLRIGSPVGKLVVRESSAFRWDRARHTGGLERHGEYWSSRVCGYRSYVPAGHRLVEQRRLPAD